MNRLRVESSGIPAGMSDGPLRLGKISGLCAPESMDSPGLTDTIGTMKSSFPSRSCRCEGANLWMTKMFV